MHMPTSHSHGDSHAFGIVTAIAIDNNLNSQSAVKWAIENLINRQTNPSCILVHVHDRALYPEEFEVKQDRPPIQQELRALFLPYRGLCARRGIETKEVILHDVDVASALIDFVRRNRIDNIVLGDTVLTRSYTKEDISRKMLKFTSKRCAVYVISKGEIQASRTAASSHEEKQNIKGVRIDSEDEDSDESSQNSVRSWDIMNRDSMSDFSDLWGSPSPPSTEISSYKTLSFVPSSEPVPMGEEVERLKLELKRSEEMYNSVLKEAILAKQMARELQQLQALGECKLREAKVAEEAALAMAEAERQKSKAAIEAAEVAQRLSQMEAQKRKQAEIKAKVEAEAKSKLLETLGRSGVSYRKYTLKELEEATNGFCLTNKIGEGGYGPVFKGLLNHTPVAIKILRPGISKGQKQFQQEVEVLSSIRHPHIVMLVGACPEYGCLVYEYLENGSLDDLLFERDETVSWRVRFRICYEIASALLFLHQTEPNPLVHRDLKPANILIDKNFVSKIGDVGLARLVPFGGSNCEHTAAAGTLCYIDPEYQQSGILGVKTDLYSFGVMMLQIISAKLPLGLTHVVEEAIEDGTFSELLDQRNNRWPEKETVALAKLALKCCELQAKDRPDLGSEVLPELLRLKNFALADVTMMQLPPNVPHQMKMKEKKANRWSGKLLRKSRMYGSKETSEWSHEKGAIVMRKNKPLSRKRFWSSLVVCGSQQPHATHMEIL